MYADLGEDHPGTDCFVLKRELAERLVLEKIVIGAQFFAFALRCNLYILANSVREHRRMHMTFHLGDSREWLVQDDYSQYNLVEIERMFESLRAQREACNEQALSDFYIEFGKRKAHWVARRKTPSPD
jgi:hypothetical protein